MQHDLTSYYTCCNKPGPVGWHATYGMCRRRQCASVGCTGRLCTGALVALVLLNAVSAQPLVSRQLQQQEGAVSGTLNNWYDPADDIAAQRAALLALYQATSGSTWQSFPSNSSSQFWTAWGAANTSYCRWRGVSCCATSPMAVPCGDASSVAVLNLAGFGLQGTLPDVFSSMPHLSALNLANNPGLVGTFPSSMGHLSQLLWMSVQGTAIVACQDSSVQLPATHCQLPSYLSFGTAQMLPGALLQCQPVLFQSFTNYTANLPASAVASITQPFSGTVEGAVVAGPSFTNFFSCTCSSTGDEPLLQNGVAQCSQPQQNTSKYVIAIVLVAVLPQVIIAIGIYVFVKHKATLHKLIRSKEAELQRKRGKVPGTPGIVLQNGRNMLEEADVSVTWVFTDVADSTTLWEWNPDVMDRSIDLHNQIMRGMLDEFGGHEIRNEGDSFTLSFHDALDAVKFCLNAQETLMAASWPTELLGHESGGVIKVGDLTGNPLVAGRGGVVMAGLRVRMGVNTGVPDDIFIHDVTAHVDYRGKEFDLAGEICDLAAGGQILLGPKTFHRWNKNYSEIPDAMNNMLGDNWRDGNGSFVNGSNNKSKNSSLIMPYLRGWNGSQIYDGIVNPSRGVSEEGQGEDGTQGFVAKVHAYHSSFRRPQPLQASYSFQQSGFSNNSLPHLLTGNSGMEDPEAGTQPASFKDVESHGSPTHVSPGRLTRSLAKSWSMSHALPNSMLLLQSTGTPHAFTSHADHSSSPTQQSTEHASAFGSAVDHTASPCPAPSMQSDAVASGSAGHLPSLAVRPDKLLSTKMSVTSQSGGNSFLPRMFNPFFTQGHQALFNPYDSSCAINIDSGPQQELPGMPKLWDAPDKAGPMSAGTSMNQAAAFGNGEGKLGQHSGNGASRLYTRYICCGTQVFRRLVSRILSCLHLMTSSDEYALWDDQQSKLGAPIITPSYKDTTLKGVILDMGYYDWRPIDNRHNTGMLPPQQQQMGPLPKMSIHLMQIVPSSVAPRVLLFEWPLATGPNWEKISFGFFDAPGSERLVFSSMRELMDPGDQASSRPIVSIAFSAIDGFKEISALNLDLAREMLQLHNPCVRETLSACGGYECKEFNGSFMTAFTDSCSAVEWALTLQLALMGLPWALELSHMEMAAEVQDPETQQFIFRGLRCRVGIYSGSIDRVTPHVKTGRADYFGQPVNRAARLMSAAHGGMIVCERSLMDGVIDEWRRRYGMPPAAAAAAAAPDSPASTHPGSPVPSPGDVRMARSFVSTSFTKLQQKHRPHILAPSPVHGHVDNFTGLEGTGGSTGALSSSSMPMPTIGGASSEQPVFASPSFSAPHQQLLASRSTPHFHHSAALSPATAAFPAHLAGVQAAHVSADSIPNPAAPAPSQQAHQLLHMVQRYPSAPSLPALHITSPTSPRAAPTPTTVSQPTPWGSGRFRKQRQASLGSLHSPLLRANSNHSNHSMHSAHSHRSMTARSASMLFNSPSPLSTIMISARNWSDGGMLLPSQPSTAKHSQTCLAYGLAPTPSDAIAVPAQNLQPSHSEGLAFNFMGSPSASAAYHDTGPVASYFQSMGASPFAEQSQGVLTTGSPVERSLGTEPSRLATRSSFGAQFLNPAFNHGACSLHGGLQHGGLQPTEGSETLHAIAPTLPTLGGYSSGRASAGQLQNQATACATTHAQPLTPLLLTVAHSLPAAGSLPFSPQSTAASQHLEDRSSGNTANSLTSTSRQIGNQHVPLDKASIVRQSSNGGACLPPLPPHSAILHAQSEHFGRGPLYITSSSRRGAITPASSGRSHKDGSNHGNSAHPDQVDFAKFYATLDYVQRSFGNDRHGNLHTPEPIPRPNSSHQDSLPEHMVLYTQASQPHLSQSPTACIVHDQSGMLMQLESPNNGALAQSTSPPPPPPLPLSKSAPYPLAFNRRPSLLAVGDENPLFSRHYRHQSTGNAPSPSPASTATPHAPNPPFSTWLQSPLHAATAAPANPGMEPGFLTQPVALRGHSAPLSPLAYGTTVRHPRVSAASSSAAVAALLHSPAPYLGTAEGLPPLELPQASTPPSTGSSHQTSVMHMAKKGKQGAPSGGSAADLVSKDSKSKEKSKEAAEEVATDERRVIAECFKITQQVTGKDTSPFITMIKFTNLSKDHGEIQEEALEEQEAVPTSTTLIPDVPVDVAVWNMGLFRLKGVTELMKIVQIMPLLLEQRLNHLPKGALNKGKARCIQRHIARTEVLTIRLPDVSRLSCCTDRAQIQGMLQHQGSMLQLPEIMAITDEGMPGYSSYELVKVQPMASNFPAVNMESDNGLAPISEAITPTGGSLASLALQSSGVMACSITNSALMMPQEQGPASRQHTLGYANPHPTLHHLQASSTPGIAAFNPGPYSTGIIALPMQLQHPQQLSQQQQQKPSTSPTQLHHSSRSAEYGWYSNDVYDDVRASS